ncbi:hypothetical protein MUCCIDRAFT_155847, partial [Mucor lusitanicus CBS 277.49]
MTAIAILLFKYTVMFLLPFNELRKVATGKAIQDADLAAKFDNLEKTWMTFVSENKNNQANNSNINTSNASSSNDASTSANTKPSSSPVSPPSYVSAVSSPSSSSSESLQATVKHVREQSIAAALDLSDKIDSLKQENEALNAHIVALQNQLATEKSEADNFSHTLANRIDILERYIQNDAKFEDKKKR